MLHQERAVHMGQKNLSCARMAPPSTTRTSGFTLVEMAVVLLVVTLLLGGLLVPLTTQIEQRKISETQNTLDEAREALVGFVIANGRLPCPASDTSNGQESFAAGGDAGNGNCSNFFDGFLPAATLGLTPVDNQGYAIDGWGGTQNRIRYAVSDATVNAVTFPFTRTNGIKTATMEKIGPEKLLYVCASAPISAGSTNHCGTALTLTDHALFVVYSVGKNAASGGTGPDESINPNPNHPAAQTFPAFVSHQHSVANGNEFDDIVSWLSPNILFNRMVAAGQLP